MPILPGTPEARERARKAGRANALKRKKERLIATLNEMITELELSPEEKELLEGLKNR